MTTGPTLIVLIVAISLMSGFVLLTLRQRSQVKNLGDLERNWRAVDAASMMNLFDPREERFLQEQLPPDTYKVVLRKRLSASRVYLKNLSANCRLLVSAG